MPKHTNPSRGNGTHRPSLLNELTVVISIAPWGPRDRDQNKWLVTFGVLSTIVRTQWLAQGPTSIGRIMLLRANVPVRLLAL